jgi:hypothetical protein
MNESDIRRVGDMRFQGRRINSNPPRLDRLGFDQVTSQLFVERGDPFFTEPLVELDECRGVRYRVHQAQPAEVPSGEPFADLSLHFLVTEAPAELQVHHPEVDIDRRTGAAHGRIKHGLERPKKLTFGQKFIDMLQLLIQLEQLGIEEAFAEAQLAIRLTSHMNVLQRLFCYRTLEITRSSV